MYLGLDNSFLLFTRLAIPPRLKFLHPFRVEALEFFMCIIIIIIIQRGSIVRQLTPSKFLTNPFNIETRHPLVRLDGPTDGRTDGVLGLRQAQLH